MPKSSIQPEIRFWEKVSIGNPDECWLWKACTWGEYGGFWNGFELDGAHRFSLEIKLGRRLQDGECALHTCDNKKCVNPNHLFSGTNDDNSKDMVRKHRKEIGINVHGARLNDKKVVKIRKLDATNKYTLEQLGAMFDVRPETVWHVIYGYTWKHVGGPIRTHRKKPRIHN